MIYARLKDNETGKETGAIFYCWGDLHRATFSPNVEPVAVVDFKLHGKTYAERRESLRDIAITLQANECGGLYQSEYIKIGAWLEKNAARYGLIKEFKENAVI